MNSIAEGNELGNRSVKALIDWSSPKKLANTTYEENYYNNPFDIMELRAANMDPFDLVHHQTSLKEDVSCSSVLNTSWKLEIGPMWKSFSSTDNNGNEPMDVSVSPSTVDYDRIDLEKIASCTEEEKQQIREQTLQRIKMLVENIDTKYEECHIDKSLSVIGQQYSESSLNNTESLFNKGFMRSDSNSISNSLYKTPVDLSDISTPNISLVYSNVEQKCFSINSLKPEWIMNSFSNYNGYVEVQADKSEPVVEPYNNNNEIDMKLKALNRIGIVESESNGSRTFLKSIQNKRTENKGPVLENIPDHYMIKNYKDTDMKKICLSKIIKSQLKPVASSTPTNTSSIATSFHSSLSEECSITASSKQAVINSVESPKTPFNATKCVKQNPTNLNAKANNTIPQLNDIWFGSANKRSKTITNLFDHSAKDKTEIIKSFQSNKSKSEGTIEKITKPMALKTTKISSLPVPKQTAISLIGKEKVTP
ncbi:Hypothetical protein CINCED_3A000392 [Cinara cedri]|uniref:Uncharacterized protein n=1 Tax=Cinara cedri TaxID=506608 RepID=A0A5E4MIQ6_9HEMI|nr:Hypothetical protein CINCED_3A000392 [Cinara cedri]